MSDNGYRPSYNVQCATDTETRLIVGRAVGNTSTHNYDMVPMVDQIERRFASILPQEYLADGRYATLVLRTRSALSELLGRETLCRVSF
jgi:hypothetical protein